MGRLNSELHVDTFRYNDRETGIKQQQQKQLSFKKVFTAKCSFRQETSCHPKHFMKATVETK